MPDPSPGMPATIPVTVASTMSAAALAPVITWVANGCPRPMPPDVALSLGALLIIAAHGLQKLAAVAVARWVAPEAPPLPLAPPPPAA